MRAPNIVITYRGLGESPLGETVLRQVGAQVTYVDTLDAPEVRQADALLVTIQPVTASVVGTLERCKIISRVGVGLDNIDLPAATARGIWVTNVPDYAIDEVSMHAIALMLAHMRRIPTYAAATRAGHWDGSTASTMRRPGMTTLRPSAPGTRWTGSARRTRSSARRSSCARQQHRSSPAIS